MASSQNGPNIRQIVAYLVEHLVDHPDQVKIESEEQEDAAIFRLSVAEEDKGKVIGRQGKVIKAIRTVASAAAGGEKRIAIDLE